AYCLDTALAGLVGNCPEPSPLSSPHKAYLGYCFKKASTPETASLANWRNHDRDSSPYSSTKASLPCTPSTPLYSRFVTLIDRSDKKSIDSSRASFRVASLLPRAFFLRTIFSTAERYWRELV